MRAQFNRRVTLGLMRCSDKFINEFKRDGDGALKMIAYGIHFDVDFSRSIKLSTQCRIPVRSS